MAALVVFLQQVQSKIAFKVAPNGMNVVGVVLRVVELDQETGRLNPVVVSLTGLLAAGPGEEQMVSCLLYTSPF